MHRQLQTQPQAASTPMSSLMPLRSGVLQRACACGNHTGAGGECEECRKKREGTLQRAAISSAPMGDAAPIVHEVLGSPGQPLDAATRAFMQPRFHHDFSQVRVHTDTKAAESARAVDALAYTVGRDVVFGAGQYRPQSSAGRRLLAHELTHVVQQSMGAVSPRFQFWGGMSDQNEFEADAVAARVTGASAESRGGALRIAGVAPAQLMRAPDKCLDECEARFDDCLKHTRFPPECIGARSMCQRGCPSPGAPGQAQQEQQKQESQPAKTAPTCTTPYKSATSFQRLIDLVRAAEGKLRGAGITSTKDQIHALRGIYYGTTWSLDFSVEKSITRNEGFQRFTRSSEAPDKSIPPDIRGILDCGLFEALKASQDIVDPSGRHLDFGHLIIGLDARFDPKFASNVTYPYMGINIDMGGTGTELVTWVGDLGGGTASLAIKRAAVPGTNVRTSFMGSDYGGSINLEGDVAASVVATSSTSALTAPTFAPGKGLADTLQDYLSPGSSSSSWKSRASTFLTMNGGVIDASGTLTNRPALVAAFSAKFQTFACNYLASRVKDGHITYGTAKSAAEHVIPAAQEVAETFVDALEDSRKSGDKIEAKRFPSPKPAKSGACSQQLAAAGFINLFK